MAGEEMINLTRLGDFHADMTVDAHILKRSTVYAVDDKVNKGLIYLKCTQAGTTASTALSLSGVSAGDTLTDGTAEWKVISITGVPEGGGTGAGLEDWESNHNYAVDDIYVYEGEIYKTLIAFTSGATEDSRTKVNNIVPSVWAANTVYTAGDIIEHTDVTTLKKVYYNVTSNFTSGATFEVTAEMQELQIVEEYVPNPLTKQQVQNLINNFVPSGSGTDPIFYNDSPIGTIIAYMGTTAPKDYLICDGQTYNIVDYKELAEYIKVQFGSYNYFGGDGTTTFAVPDLRGEFLRGTGTNSHANQGSGANVGVHQDATNIPNFKIDDAFEGIAGDIFDGYAGGIHNEDTQLNYTTNGTSTNTTYDYTNYTQWTGYQHDSYTHMTVRPTNTSVLYCIKYNTLVLSTPENNYSTEEQRIGTWIDGKPLYQITIQDTMPTVTTDGTRADKTISIASLNVDTGVSIDGMINNSNSFGYTCLNSWNNPQSYSVLSFDKTTVSNDSIWYASSRAGDSQKPVFITLQYTKTTD